MSNRRELLEKVGFADSKGYYLIPNEDPEHDRATLIEGWVCVLAGHLLILGCVVAIAFSLAWGIGLGAAGSVIYGVNFALSMRRLDRQTVRIASEILAERESRKQA